MEGQRKEDIQKNEDQVENARALLPKLSSLLPQAAVGPRSKGSGSRRYFESMVEFNIPGFSAWYHASTSPRPYLVTKKRRDSTRKKESIFSFPNQIQAIMMQNACSPKFHL